ncbi:MAG: hypothetical protein K0Q79_1144 [Flavipsychrobacter sp.]|nr:hypothetical protein [Flavipsychrobacter sp.]
MWRYCVVPLLVACGCSQIQAQNVVFTAVAGANKIGLRNQVQVQYTIRDAQNLQSVSTPSTNDFAIVAGPYQQQSTSVNMSGNQVTQSQSISLTYVLQPKHEGTFTIPPVTAKDAAGHVYQSNPVTIQVVAGTVGQPQNRQQDPYGGDDDVFAAIQQMQQAHMQRMQQMMGGGNQPRQAPPGQRQAQPQQEAPEVSEDEIKKDLFIKVVADKTKVNVGEQVTISYKLYTRLAMNVAISKLPSLNGFWTQDFDIPRQPKPAEEVINGRKYQVYLLKKSALFPQETGTLVLDEAEAKGVARIVQQVKRRMSDMLDPFGGGTLFMNDPFFNNAYYNTMAYRDVQVHIKSDPLKINVSPLPEKDRPENYGGAVGRFTITGKIDKPELTTDDVATLTLTISGSGNIKLIEAPKPELPNGINTYDPQIVDTITGRSTTISGSKIISYVITPHTPGDYNIAPIPFTFYDPTTGAYVTEHTQPLKLTVKPGKHYTPSQTAPGGKLALKDIHDISKRPIDKLVLNSKPLLLTPTYWSLYALPILAFIGLAVIKRRDEELSKDTALLRNKRANKVALQRLATAKKLLAQNAKTPFYEEISKAIWLYLSDKLGIPLSSLSRETATIAMNNRNVPEAIQRNLENVIWECETALYATGGSKQMAHTYEEAIKVISELEEVFKA